MGPAQRTQSRACVTCCFQQVLWTFWAFLGSEDSSVTNWGYQSGLNGAHLAPLSFAELSCSFEQRQGFTHKVTVCSNQEPFPWWLGALNSMLSVVKTFLISVCFRMAHCMVRHHTSQLQLKVPEHRKENLWEALVMGLNVGGYEWEGGEVFAGMKPLVVLGRLSCFQVNLPLSEFIFCCGWSLLKFMTQQ